MTHQRKSFPISIEQLGPRIVRVICSTDTVDRSGEVIVQEGIDLSAFKANPIILWGHDPMHPVGTATAIGVVDGKLQAEIEFAAEGLSQKADEICALVKAGVVKTVSIGFDPVEVEPMDPAKPKGPKRYLKSILYENSFVSIPANPDAVVVQRAKDGETDPEGNMANGEGGETTKHFGMPQTKGLQRRDFGSLKIKDLYDVSSLLYLLQDLGWRVDRARIEAALEGDGSDAAEVLLGILQQLGQAIIDIAKEEIEEEIVKAGGTLGEEDLLEDLPMDDAAIVCASKTPAARRFRQGWYRTKAVVIAKEGRVISRDTAATIQECLDHHDKCMKALRAATKCMKGLLPDETQEDSGTNEDEPGVPGDAEGGDKGLPGLMTKEARLARAKALAPAS